MNYLLAVLTHGPAPNLLRAVASFADNVRPHPVSAIIHADGQEAVGPAQRVIESFPEWPWILTSTHDQRGFCAATADLWASAALGSHPWVYWLEHDFEHLGLTVLGHLAAPLAQDTKIAQMALMRDAVNEAEKEAGGLYEYRPDRYWPQPAPHGIWLEHSAYFTTNPSLMRREFMAENPWPEYERECEGRFGLDLIERGYRFGAWGSGEPWVRHVGERSGFGY